MALFLKENLKIIYNKVTFLIEGKGKISFNDGTIIEGIWE